jgi:phage terminase large subunit-like protein
MDSLRKLQADPAEFRRVLLIDADAGPVKLGDVLDPWQQQDFLALDPAWCRVVGQDVPCRWQRAYLERPRGHAKTSDIAVSVTWTLFASRRKLSGIAAAADEDQAALIRDAVDRLLRLNPWLREVLDVQRGRILNRHTGSELRIISSDAPTSYGLTPDFVVCDELTHWRNRELWDSLLSASAKRRHCFLLIIANAGFTESWQAETQAAIRADAGWYFHRLDGCCASWIGEQALDEQRRLLPGIAFDRLWLNRWSAGCGDALESRDIDAAVTSGGACGPEPGWVYVAGLDIGLSRDASALVVVGKHVGHSVRTEKPKHRLCAPFAAMADAGLLDYRPPVECEYKHVPGTGRLKVCAVKIWKPSPGRKVELEHVEGCILALREQFKLSVLSYDPWQSEYVGERLRKAGLRCEPTHFTSTSLQGMATAVLDAFRDRMIELPNTLPNHAALLADLRALRIVERNYGFRLESPHDGRGHGDAATALAIALSSARRFNFSAATTGGRKLVLNGGSVA